MPFPILTTKRLRVCNCPPEVLQFVLSKDFQPGKSNIAALNGARIHKRWPPEANKPVYEKWLKHLAKTPAESVWYLWLVIDHDTNTVIGDLGFQGKPDENGRLIIGYGIVDDMQGQGLTTEAASALLQWAFRQQSVRRVIAGVELINEPSRKVCRNLGMAVTTRVDDIEIWEVVKK